MSFSEKHNGIVVEEALPVERRTRVRFFLCFWLFILSAVAFLDRTNVSVAGLQISREFGLGNQHLGLDIFRISSWHMPDSSFPQVCWWSDMAHAVFLPSELSAGEL